MKFQNVVTNLHEKNEYFIVIRNLKWALNHGLVLERVNWVNKFNQNALAKTMYWHEHKSKEKSKK